MVPCLHPNHQFKEITEGPERAVVLSLSRLKEQSQTAATVNDEDMPTSNSLGVVRKFLDTFPPSKCSCEDLAWVIVDIDTTPDSTQDAESTESSHIEAAMEDWERIIERRNPTPEDVDALALKYNIRCGKWMMFPKRGTEADAAWEAVVTAAASGALDLSYYKISTVNPRENEHVLLVYTDDYFNKADVDKAAEALRRILPQLTKPRMCYKADISTHLGIYAGNEYKLKPTKYTSQL